MAVQATSGWICGEKMEKNESWRLPRTCWSDKIQHQRKIKKSSIRYYYTGKNGSNDAALSPGLGINSNDSQPGSLHDASVFANSEVQDCYTKGKFKLYMRKSYRVMSSYLKILLGDPAYSWLSSVMKEYAACQDINEFTFNTMLRSARNQTEYTFGCFKARWRILLRPVKLKLADISDIVLSCFIVHNFFQERNQL